MKVLISILAVAFIEAFFLYFEIDEYTQIFGIGSTVAICIYSFFLIDSIKTKKWSFVKGTITSYDYVHEKYGSDNYGWTKKAEYKYEVNGTLYTGNKIDFGWNFHDMSKEGARKRDEYKFKKNQPVKVYYNPIKITSSVLIPGPQPSILVPLYIYSVLLFVFLYSNPNL